MSEEIEKIQFQLTDELIEKVEQLIAENNNKELQRLLNEFHYADIAEILDELDQDEAVYVIKLLDSETTSDILMELDEDHFEQNGYFIRKINVPESAFKPAAEYQDFWLSPINNISFHLPPHLHPWLRRFINVSGNIEPPIALRSEKILTEAFQDFLKYKKLILISLLFSILIDSSLIFNSLSFKFNLSFSF